MKNNNAENRLPQAAAGTAINRRNFLMMAAGAAVVAAATKTKPAAVAPSEEFKNWYEREAGLLCRKYKDASAEQRRNVIDFF